MMEEQRLREVLKKMDELELDCLVAYFDGIPTFLEPNSVFLLSSFKSIGESLFLLNADGTSTLIITPEWDKKRAENHSTRYRVIGTNDLMGTFHNLLKTKMFYPEKTGFIGLNALNRGSLAQMTSIFGENLKHVDQTFLELGSRKTMEELEKAKKATWIAERGYEKLLEVARPGVYEYQLASEIDNYMKSLGADDNFLLMSASKHNRAVRPPGNRLLEKGDIILVEISPSVQGQFTQICRSVVLGEPEPQLQKILKETYCLLIEAMQRGIASAVPGEKMSTLVREMNKPIEEAGYREYCKPPYMRVRGHGLGLSSILPGEVSLDNDTILEEGMFFVIHPNQYIPETGYLLCGEPVLITSEGAKSLSEFGPALDIIQLGGLQ